MQRAFSFPATLERSRTKERLEASLSGLCELELRRQRQECLVLGALALGEPLGQDDPRRELSCFSSWGQQNLTLRRQLNALQSSPWGLMQALEQQVGELRIDIDDGCCDGAQGDTGDSRPSSGFYESSEGQSPKGKPSTAELTETVPTHVYANDRPKSVADPLVINGEFDVQMPHPSLPRSFSAPHPPLEGIMEEGSAGDAWQWDFRGANPAWLQEAAEDHLTEEDYQQALRVEGYILSLVQRHTLSPRPCQPRTTLNPDPPHGNVSGHSSQHWRTPSQSAEQRLPDPHHQPYVDLLTNSKSHAWGCDLPEVGACRGEAQLFEKDCHLAPPYPQSRPNSLTGRLPSPLLSMDPNGSVGLPDLFCDPPSPQHYLCPLPPVPHNLVSAQYISGQSCQAPVRSPRHYKSEQPKPSRAAASPDHPSSKYKASKKGQSDRQRSKKTNSKTGRSQSENSLLAQRGLPERRYSTTERRQDKTNPSPNKAPAAGPQVSNNGRNNGHNGNRRWCSNLELSQDEAETQTSAQAHKRPPRKIRHGHPCSHSQQQHAQRWHQDCQSRAPLGQGGEAYASAAAPPAESESSTSEVYTPASSSLSSDSDESGGLVWPQQLPPRLASTSSSSSPSPQAAASASSHPKAFVKIKASHALKKKILRFRSGSLKVMTTV